MKNTFIYLNILILILLTGCSTLNTNTCIVSYSQTKTVNPDDYPLILPVEQPTFEIAPLDWSNDWMRLCTELEKDRYSKNYKDDDANLSVHLSTNQHSPFEIVNSTGSNNFYFGGINGIITLRHFDTPLAQKVLATLTNYLGPNFSDFIIQKEKLQSGERLNTIIRDYSLTLECFTTADGTLDYSLYIIYSGVSLKDSAAQTQLETIMGGTFLLTNVLTNGSQNILEIHEPSYHRSSYTDVYYQLYQNDKLHYDQIKLIIIPSQTQNVSDFQLLPLEKLLGILYPTQTIDLSFLKEQITSSIEGKLNNAKGQLYDFSYTLHQLTSPDGISDQLNQRLILVTLKNSKI